MKFLRILFLLFVSPLICYSQTDVAVESISIMQPGPFVYGDGVNFQITIRNNGPLAVKNITLMDLIPCGLSYTGGSQAWTPSGNNRVTTIASTLNAGQSISIFVDFTIGSCFSNNAWLNSVSVTSYEDVNNNNIFGSDTNALNNVLTKEVAIYDLALIKTLVTPAPYSYGDTLTFNIEVINQGNQPVSGFQLNDYLPVDDGYFFDSSLNPFWTGGPYLFTKWVTVNPMLNPGQSEIVTIRLVLLRTNGGERAWVNFAEISLVTDLAGNFVFDADSTPGSNSINENAVLPGSPNDNNISGGGLGNNEDEDDHDPAGADVFDLALTKMQGSALLSFSYLQDVEYVFTIFNQGSIPATNIEITDYLSSALQYMATPKNVLRGWTYNNISHTAKILYTKILMPGQSDTLKLDLAPIQFYTDPNNAWTDFAEITDADDIDPNTPAKPLDIDSNSDVINGNDAGGKANSPSDNEINGNGTGTPGDNVALTDEDDHDPHKIQIFDLALRQTKVTPGTYFQIGQDVTFDMTIFNQGNVPAKNIVITDYLPDGFTFVAGGPNVGWSTSGPNVIYTVPSVLFPGTNVTVPVTLKVNSSALPGAHYNYAELSAAMDTLNNNRNDDADSVIDSDPANDNQVLPGSADDDNILGNSFIGGDQDDHDVASIELLCQLPTLTVGIPQCEPGNGTYNVTYYSNVSDIDAGIYSVLGNQIVNIPVGTNVSVTASNGANCSISLTVASPPTCPGNGGCIYPKLTVGQPVCETTSWSVSFSNDLGNIFPSAGTVSGNRIINIPFNTNLTVTASNGNCVASVNVSAPVNCGVNCANSPISISGPVCETNGAGTYSVNFIALPNTTVTVSSGILDLVAGTVTGILSGVDLTMTVTTPGCDTRVIIVPAGDCPVCQRPTLTVGLPQCDPSNGSYNVTFYSNVIDITAGPYQISGNKVINIPLGNNVLITASNGLNCSQSLTVVSPSNCPGTGGCTYPKLTVGQPLCNVTSWSVSFSNDLGIVSSTAGTVSGSRIINIPLNTNISVTAVNGNCTTRINITAPTNCGIPCANSPISISGPVCESNGTGTYAVNFITSPGTSVSASSGVLNSANGTVTGITSGVNLTLTVTTPGCDTRVIVVPAGNCNPGTASVGSFIWHDINGDGQQNSGEPGVAGVKVILFDELSAQIAFTFSNATGQYSFLNVPPGNYYIQFISPTNYELTFSNIGDDNLDSDAGNFNGPGTTPLFTLLSGQTNNSIDAGLYRCIPIGDLVWYDINKNDVWNTNENGINGLRVNLWRQHFGTWLVWDYKYTGPKPGSPSDDGYFNFCAPPGDYYVEVIMPPLGLVRAKQNVGNNEEVDSDISSIGKTDNFKVLSGQSKNDLGAGFYPMAVVGNLVWQDDNLNGIQDAGEARVAGVNVEAIEVATGKIAASSVTDQEGIYNLNYLEKQDYYLKFSPPAGYSATISGAGEDDKDSDVDHSLGLNTTRILSMQPGSQNNNIDMGIAYGVLPVTWLDIRAEKTAKGNFIQWKVGGEWNVSHYVVERKSSDDTDFVDLPGNIPALQIGRQTAEYSYDDGDILSGKTYLYRIRQIDLDGRFSYSKIVVVNSELDFSINLYPNPARNASVLEISLAESKLMDIEIFNMQYQKVKTVCNAAVLPQGNHKFAVDLMNLPEGVYLIRVKTDNTEVFERKLIVTR